MYSRLIRLEIRSKYSVPRYESKEQAPGCKVSDKFTFPGPDPAEATITNQPSKPHHHTESDAPHHQNLHPIYWKLQSATSLHTVPSFEPAFLLTKYL